MSGRPSGEALPGAIRDELARLLDGLRFGSIEIQVHDGRVVSIERRERVRPHPGSPTR